MLNTLSTAIAAAAGAGEHFPPDITNQQWQSKRLTNIYSERKQRAEEVEVERLQYLLQVAFSQQAQWLPGENKQLKARAQQSIAIQGSAPAVELPTFLTPAPLLSPSQLAQSNPVQSELRRGEPRRQCSGEKSFK